MRVTTYRTKLNEDRLNILVKEKAVNYTTHSKLTSPSAIYDMMVDVFDMKNLAEEYLYLIAFDTKQSVLGVFEISHGTVNSSLISPREVFIKALLCGAVNVVLVHNHPSGDPSPSNADMQVTRRIKESGELLGVKLLDHVIVGDSYYSMSEFGLI